MKKTLGLLFCAVLAAMFIMDVPSGHAIMGIRAARTALAARRAKQKMAETEESKTEDLRTAKKPVPDKRGNPDDPTDPARQG